MPLPLNQSSILQLGGKQIQIELWLDHAVAHLKPLPTIATARSSKYSMKAKFAQRRPFVVSEIGAAGEVAWFIIIFSVDRC